MTLPGSQPATKTFWQRIYTPHPISAAAVIVGWVGVYFVYYQQWVGFLLCIGTSILTLVALRRGKAAAARPGPGRRPEPRAGGVAPSGGHPSRRQ